VPGLVKANVDGPPRGIISSRGQKETRVDKDGVMAPSLSLWGDDNGIDIIMADKGRVPQQTDFQLRHEKNLEFEYFCPLGVNCTLEHNHLHLFFSPIFAALSKRYSILSTT